MHYLEILNLALEYPLKMPPLVKSNVEYRLQHFETLLKELNSHPGSDPVPPDQNEVEYASLSDRNLNVQCESGIFFPSLLVMLHRQKTQIKKNGNLLPCTRTC